MQTSEIHIIIINYHKYTGKPAPMNVNIIYPTNLNNKTV